MRILACTPHYNEWCWVMYARSMSMTRWPEGAQVDMTDSYGMQTPKAMEMFARHAIEGGYDYLVVTCNDAAWQPNAICDLIKRDKDVISGWSAGRWPPHKPNVFTDINRKDCLFRRDLTAERKGLLRVYAVAGEVQVYKTSVFKLMDRPLFSGVINSEGVATTDDLAFGCRAYDAGVEIWLDWDVKISHIASGWYSFDGELHNMLMPRQSKDAKV